MVGEHPLSDVHPFCADRDSPVARATVCLVDSMHAVERKADLANVEIMFYKHHSGEGGYLPRFEMVRGKVRSFFFPAHSKHLLLSEDSGV